MQKQMPNSIKFITIFPKYIGTTQSITNRHLIICNNIPPYQHVNPIYRTRKITGKGKNKGCKHTCVSSQSRRRDRRQADFKTLLRPDRLLRTAPAPDEEEGADWAAALCLLLLNPILFSSTHHSETKC